MGIEMSRVMMRAAIFAFALVSAPPTKAAAAQASLPTDVTAQIPSGYEVLAIANLSAGQPLRSFMIVALGRMGEAANGAQQAPPRPLMIFERRGAHFVAAGRNDHVVMKADEGGQCDPFLDGDATIAVKGRYFTVQNGVACGEHWTDYVTFRLDERIGGFVFDNERIESWSLNPSDKPDAEALIRDGKPTVARDRPGRTTIFDAWRPDR